VDCGGSDADRWWGEGGSTVDERSAAPDACNSPMGSPGTIYCAAYISGVGGVIETNGIALSRFTPRDANVLKTISACGDTTVGASVQAFKNWAQAHPELWTQDAPSGVMMALRQTWPCP